MPKDTPVAEILMLLGDAMVTIHERDKEIRRLNQIVESQQKMIDEKNQVENNNG